MGRMAASVMACLSICAQIAVLAAPVSVADLVNRLLITGSLSSAMLVLPVETMVAPSTSESRKPKPFGQSGNQPPMAMPMSCECT